MRTSKPMSPKRPSLWLALFTLLLQLILPVASQTPNYQYANPVQVRIDPFLVRLGPTDTGDSPALTLTDAEVVLGLIEDRITTYSRDHFEGNDDTDFKYAILALVNILENGENATSTSATTFEFSGGVSYFGGSSSVLPSEAEMQMLVDLALSSEALEDAVSEQFPYITDAAYAPKSMGFEDGEVQVEEATEAQGGEEESDFAVNRAIQDENQNQMDNDQQDNQFLVVIVSACSAGLVLVVLLVGVAVKHNKRNSLWRDDAAKDAAESLDGMTLDGFHDTKSPNRNSSKGSVKQQSLHMRDSLRQMSEVEEEQSEAGSSLIGRLAAAAAAIPACASRDEGDNHGNETDKDKANNSRGSGDTHSSSDISEKSDTHSNNGEAGPSDFEGNAVVKPNLVPIADPNSFDDDVNDPLPPSQIASRRRDERPIRSTSLSRNNSQQGMTAKTNTPEKKTYTHESFLSKYWNPLLPLGSYFSNTGNTKDEDEGDNKNGGSAPRTPATDMDARWSDISSDHQTEDFELDQAWDPDDASFISGEVGKDIFSPIPGRQTSQDEDEDDVELLRASKDTKYNLEKLRTPPSKVKTALASRKLQQETENTAAV